MVAARTSQADTVQYKNDEQYNTQQKNNTQKKGRNGKKWRTWLGITFLDSSSTVASRSSHFAPITY
jgi:hypothetical protein